jgi:hypothetical protein
MGRIKFYSLEELLDVLLLLSRRHSLQISPQNLVHPFQELKDILSVVLDVL